MAPGNQLDLKVCIQNDGTATEAKGLRGTTAVIDEHVGQDIYVAEIRDSTNADRTHEVFKKKSLFTEDLAPGAIAEFTLRLNVPADLNKKKLDANGDIKIALKAVSDADRETVDAFNIVIHVTNP